jgi:uncharacterized Zn ribbon protein
MGKNISNSEYVIQTNGAEVCPECGHLWTEYSSGHYHDCRYFSLQDDQEEDIALEDEEPLHMPIFRPAA